MGDLLELAARVEAAKGPDRKLDASIACAVLGYVLAPGRAWLFHDPADKWRRSRSAAGYTLSLDAAATLIPDGWDWAVGTSGLGFGGHAFIGQSGKKSSEAATPALALCAAALRARTPSAVLQHGGGGA